MQNEGQRFIQFIASAAAIQIGDKVIGSTFSMQDLWRVPYLHFLLAPP